MRKSHLNFGEEFEFCSKLSYYNRISRGHSYIWSRFSWSIHCVNCVGRIQTRISCNTRGYKPKIERSGLCSCIVENQKLIVVSMAKELCSNYIFKPILTEINYYEKKNVLWQLSVTMMSWVRVWIDLTVYK